MMENVPLDHPWPQRNHRVYAALTNSCNRSCPWCSTCSSPAGSTFLPVEDFVAALPPDQAFEIQLEGGEPTIHPGFWEFVRISLEHPGTTRLVLCTNGATMPRREIDLRSWVDRLGKQLTLKLSINHHLLECDSGLIPLASLLQKVFADLSPEHLLVFNVRLRRGYEDDDAAVRELVEQAGLASQSNVFYLQRYGFASDELGWDEPFLVGHNFTLLNPDGRIFGPDLIGRSEAMRVLA